LARPPFPMSLLSVAPVSSGTMTSALTFNPSVNFFFSKAPVFA